MSLADRLSRGVKATFSGNILNKLLNGLLVVLLTRIFMTPSQYGELNFVLSALGVVSILATLGLPKSAARYVTEFSEIDPEQVPHVVRTSLKYLGILVVVVAGATLAVGRPTTTILGVPSIAPFIAVGSLYIVTQAFMKYCTALCQGFNRVDWSALIGVVNNVGRVLFVVLLVALGFGVTGALFGYIAGYVAAAVVGGYVVYTQFYTDYRPAPAADDGLSRRILEYSIPLTATRTANVIDRKIDTILVGVLLNMTAVGYYTVAKQVADFVAAPASSVGYTISPAIGEQSSADRKDRARKLYERSVQYVLLAYLPAVAGLVLVAEPMVRYVFGTNYLGAVPAVQVFAAFVLVSALNNVTSDGLDYLGRARARAIAKTGMAVSNVALNILLIPVLGVVGAAVATVITFSLYTFTNIYIIHQELEIRLHQIARWLAAVTVVTGGMAIAVWFTLPYVSGPITLFGTVLLGVVTWAVLSILGGILDPEEVTRFLT